MVNTYEGLLALLIQNKIRFMLVGGLAVSLCGFVRTTEDMDINEKTHRIASKSVSFSTDSPGWESNAPHDCKRSQGGLSEVRTGKIRKRTCPCFEISTG